MAKTNKGSPKPAKKAKANDPNQRIEEFLQYFEQEIPDVREELANTIPAYNMLLSLHAKSFEELSLMAIAKERGINCISRFSYQDVKPVCVSCGSEERVHRVEENLYRCRACNKKFSLNPNSICSGTKLPAVTWMQVLHCLLDNYTVKRTCRYCRIAPETYYNIRAKLFYAMQILLEDVKLYGLVECDNTEAHLSYKGIDLTDDEYPEDSVLDTINLIPRQARKRGGPYSNAEKNVNSVHMYAAVDNYGHCVVRYVGIGSATATKLERAVPSSRYLKEVPEQDPFPFTSKAPRVDLYDSKKTLIVSDKELAIAKYVAKTEIPHEAHVFTKKGKPLKLPEGSHNIQRVNALHNRLKIFLRRANYVSSRYLPGYLVLFEFIENTGATPEAIGRLFEILVIPGLGQPQDYYEKLYSVPDIYSEWGEDNAALKKIPYNQMRAAFMYHQKLEKEAAGEDPGYVMRNILEETGFQSPGYVRRLYKNMKTAGLMDDICKLMGAPTKVIRREIQKATTTQVPEKFLHYYDDFCAFLQSADRDKYTFEEYLGLLNKQYGETVKRNLFQHYANRIEELELRSVKLSELKKAHWMRRQNEPRVNPLWEQTFQAYIEVRKEYEAAETPVLRDDILRIVGERTGLSLSTIAKHIAKAKQQRRKEDPADV